MIVEALIGGSFLLGGLQDIRRRAVADYVWLPAIVGLAIGIGIGEIEWSWTIVVGLFVVIAFAAVRLGAVGAADGIALVFVAAVPSAVYLFPLLICISIAAVTHIGYLYATGQSKKRTISLEQFEKEPQWIPRAIFVGTQRISLTTDVNRSREQVEELEAKATGVEVQYGVPTVAYIAGGYLLYLGLLALIAPQIIMVLP